MKIDPEIVFVVVLTVMTGVFLVWIELRSRRNSQLQSSETQPQIDGATEPANPLIRTAEAARKRRRRRR